MTIIFIILIIILLSNSKITLKENNKEYISKKQTTIINSIFLILVFYSHFFTYINNINQVDIYLRFIIRNIGQFMVTTFLFYSGYGIYESIKKSKDYKNNFIKKRFIPTYINFSIAILLFIITNELIGLNFKVEQVIISFTAWDSIGNSNWYMFAIFSEYIFLILSFKLIKKDKHQILFISILSIFYIIILLLFKERHWYDTILCFPAGLYFSYYKTKIEKYILNKKKYFLILFALFLTFILLYFLHRDYPNVFIHNVMSIIFVFIITLLSIRIKFNNRIFEYLGKRLFWIYILQRIPMIIFKDIFNYQIYFIICIIITIILSEILYRITNKLHNKLLTR